MQMWSRPTPRNGWPDPAGRGTCGGRTDAPYPHRYLHSHAVPGRRCADARGRRTLFAWATAFDDTFAEVSASGKMTAEIIGAMAAALEIPPADPEPDRFAAALADGVGQLRAVMLPEQVDRIVEAMRGILVAQLWEARVDPAVVSLDEYIAMRPHSTYATLMESFVEPTNNFHLSDSVRRRPTVRRVIDACNNLMGWVNDLGSFAWEDTRGDGLPLALPTLVARDRGCTLAEAFALVSRMCDDEAAAAHRAVLRGLRRSRQRRDTQTGGKLRHARARCRRRSLIGFRHSRLSCTGRGRLAPKAWEDVASGRRTPVGAGPCSRATGPCWARRPPVRWHLRRSEGLVLQATSGDASCRDRC
ncbi:terpene synthase family protein [Pseudonocardia sp. TRM90224]|uniref:terpene synthase family protein n=1 Tax=Pseudonocardia sp. TRM90224 TaxID=2812678 RepID=UPI0035A84C46